MAATTLLALAKALSSSAVKAWLSDRTDRAERNLELSELIKLEFRDKVSQRTLRRQIETIADGMLLRLESLSEHEFRGMTPNDSRAVISAVADTFVGGNLSDASFFSSDADPIAIGRQLRTTFATRHAALGLSESADTMYEILLDECCDCYVRVVMQLAAFPPRASAEQLRRLSALGEQISVLLERMPARTMRAPEGTALDEDFRQRYLELLSESLDQLELFGVTVKHYRPRVTLSVAYLSLSVTASASATYLGRTVSTAHDKWFAQEIRPTGVSLQVETALARGHRMLLRGEAGSGKTTLLNWLAVMAARGRFAGALREWNGCVPFLVRLRAYADRTLPTPPELVDQTADSISGYLPRAWVERQLESGRALLLIDGVDELPTPRRHDVREWLRRLLAAYSRIRVVVTGRPAAAAEDWLAAEGFAPAQLEPMNQDNVAAFVNQWHEAIKDAGDLPCPVDELGRYEASLRAQLAAKPHMRALASNPLLCAMLCALNLDRTTHLPRDRMGLYSAALDMLLERRDVERDIHTGADLTAPEKISLLQDLAFSLSINGRTELDKADATLRISTRLSVLPCSDITGEQAIENLLHRSGVIREPVSGRIDFLHRTFQEYLTAKECADQNAIGLLVTNGHRDQWRETLVMAAGHTNSPQRAELITGLLDRADQEPRRARSLKLLASACLETAPSLPTDLRKRVEAGLDAVLPPHDVRESRSLASVGEPLLKRLPSDLSLLPEGSAKAIIRAAAFVNGPHALDVLSRYASDPRRAVQEQLQDMWQYFEANDYALHVLSKAPLIDGGLTVSSRSTLRATRHVENLRSLTASFERLDDLSVLNGASRVKSVIVRSGNIVDLSPLSEHRGLTHLYIYSSNMLRNIPAISSLSQLMYLTLSSVSDLGDLDFVRPLVNLHHLALFDSYDIVDIEPLATLTHLESVDLGCAPSNLNALSSLPALKMIDFDGSRLEGGLRAIAECLPTLTGLTLYNCKWPCELKHLVRLPLTQLRLVNSSITDLRPLRQMPRLDMLDISRTNTADISFVEALQGLEELDLAHNPITKLDDLITCQGLEFLFLDDCVELADLTPLSSLSGLRSLWLRGARPGLDLSPLSGKRLEIFLTEGQDVRGLSQLDSKVRVTWVPPPVEF